MASPFASLTQETLPVPDDEGQTVTIRKLTGAECDAAQAAHAEAVVAGKAGRGWSVAFRRIINRDVHATEKDAAQVLADPMTGYDRLALVHLGTVAWSYPQSLVVVAAQPAIEGKPAVAGYDALADWAEEPLDWLARTILRKTKPGLFQTVDEADEARKNG